MLYFIIPAGFGRNPARCKPLQRKLWASKKTLTPLYSLTIKSLLHLMIRYKCFLNRPLRHHNLVAQSGREDRAVDLYLGQEVLQTRNNC